MLQLSLRGLYTFGKFSTAFTGDTILVTSCFVFLYMKPLLKRVYFKRKEFAPKGSKFFPFKVDLFSKGKQNNFDSISYMPRLVSWHLIYSCGGNILINVGPTKEGRIIPLFEERLRGMGDWLKVNGEGIYGTRPWKFQNDTQTPHVW